MSTPTDLTGLDPAQRHRLVAGRFAEVTGVVGDWDAPTPVAEWVARDVIGHLVGWFPGFLAAGGVELAAGPPVADDPVAAWAAQRDAVQALLDDGQRADAEFTHPMAGAHRLGDAVDRFYTADVFMHTWDLAAAAGVEPGLDPGWSEEIVTGMTAIEELLRSSGQYGPRVPVADEADPVTRLVAFIGRDPDWRPAGA